MSKTNMWRIRGYAGFDDCDGESDYNVDSIIAMDDMFSKDDVIDLMMMKYGKKFRVVELGATFVGVRENSESNFRDEYPLDMYSALTAAANGEKVVGEQFSSGCYITNATFNGARCIVVMKEHVDKTVEKLFPFTISSVTINEHFKVI